MNTFVENDWRPAKSAYELVPNANNTDEFERIDRQMNEFIEMVDYLREMRRMVDFLGVEDFDNENFSGKTGKIFDMNMKPIETHFGALLVLFGVLSGCAEPVEQVSFVQPLRLEG